MKITVDMIMDFDPCYSREEIEKFFIDAGFEDLEATPLEIAESSYKNVNDKLWLLLSPEIISEKQLHQLSIDFALMALYSERNHGREPDTRSWQAVEAKRAWLKGLITDERLEAAELAARSAWSAALSAAGSEAWSAVWSAAESAAWSASKSAAGSAAGSASESVAWSAQLDCVIKVLRELE